ncbi:MAG: glutamate racemase [Coxiella endosymbiont of Dermacentor silvarum]
MKPGAQATVNTTKNNRVILLATEATIQSGVYQKTIFTLNSKIKIRSQTCGLFVALAEEGCIDNELDPIINDHHRCDSIILGCTHFPVFIDSLTMILGNGINIIDSATETAMAVKSITQKMNLENTDQSSELTFLVTDSPKRFARIGEIFLGQRINPSLLYLIDGIKLSH